MQNFFLPFGPRFLTLFVYLKLRASASFLQKNTPMTFHTESHQACPISAASAPIRGLNPQRTETQIMGTFARTPTARIERTESICIS
ncbi:hypothetical protein BDV39DRAFT_181510 [Aspergillus sergii]|uniref:Secreted protein n=1 Tax=Aspergillus sergii TaxID=1034303 RepID=A0A5N6WX00_9EURO|nr:hypothetical protein BDV39DRAFT_181510 [Aspergillus sergii]